jgi:hypothetical protein
MDRIISIRPSKVVTGVRIISAGAGAGFVDAEAMISS